MARPIAGLTGTLRIAALLVACASTAAACPGDSGGPVVNGGRGVAIHGRVVDFETCLSRAGCAGVAALRVSVFANSALVSERTSPDGAFLLPDIPEGSRVHLIITDATGAGRFLPTLQAAELFLDTEDLFGVECYALQARGGLYAAIQEEAQLAVESQGLHLGQVVQITEGTMKALEAVTPTVTPRASLRFVRDNPRFSPGQEALFPPDRSMTGIFGQFVVIGDAQQQLYRIALSSEEHSFEPIDALLGAGYLSIAMHRGTGKR